MSILKTPRISSKLSNLKWKQKEEHSSFFFGRSHRLSKSKPTFLRPDENLPRTCITFYQIVKHLCKQSQHTWKKSNRRGKVKNLNKRGEIKGNFYSYSKYWIDYKQSLTYVIQLPMIHIFRLANSALICWALFHVTISCILFSCS